MQQIADPPPVGARSRRFPPRRRTVAVPDPSGQATSEDERADALALRMDRLEAALRLVARANKEVLRTLDPRFDGRAELAVVVERLAQLGSVAETIRGELGRSSGQHETVRGELEGLREAVGALAQRIEEAPARQPRPVTRLADVRARLARVSEELAEHSEVR